MPADSWLNILSIAVSAAAAAAGAYGAVAARLTLLERSTDRAHERIDSIIGHHRS